MSALNGDKIRFQRLRKAGLRWRERSRLPGPRSDGRQIPTNRTRAEVADRRAAFVSSGAGSSPSSPPASQRGAS